MTSGSATAKASSRRVSMLEIVIAFGDSSSTGNSVQADIDHSEVMSVPLASAPATGSSKGRPERRRRQAAVGVGGPDHIGKRRAARPPGDQRDSNRHRHIAGRAGEITERGGGGFGERLFAVHADRIGERRKVVLVQARPDAG